jgi:hypothetical protein
LEVNERPDRCGTFKEARCQCSAHFWTLCTFKCPNYSQKLLRIKGVSESHRMIEFPMSKSDCDNHNSRRPNYIWLIRNTKFGRLSSSSKSFSLIFFFYSQKLLTRLGEAPLAIFRTSHPWLACSIRQIEPATAINKWRSILPLVLSLRNLAVAKACC